MNLTLLCSLAVAGLLLASATLGQPAARVELNASPPIALPATSYLFSYFTGNGEDGLHLAWSRDGLNWETLNGGRSFLSPQIGGKLMRDPCIAQGPDGLFHMVWTDSWSGQTIGYASSPDLMHWSEQRTLPVMQHEPTTHNCWAPEIVYDAKAKHFLIFWASTIPGRFASTEFDGKNDNNHRIYSTTTHDFRTFTPTKLFFDPGFNAIDSTLLHAGDKILMFFKDETRFPRAQKNLYVASAPNYSGPYEVQLRPLTPVGDWVEGPTALKIGDYTYLYFDVYTKGRYDALRSRDLENWENVTGQLRMPKGARHGTAFSVSADALRPLLQNTGN